MGESLAGVVLAAGGGTRLAPLTRELPKALCPVAGVPLVDLALARLAAAGLAGPGEVAVNAHAHASALVDHLGERVHVSVERELLGTGGALGHLAPWIDGRAVVLVNADAVHDASLAALLGGWDGERIRFLVAGDRAPRLLGREVRLCGVVMPPAALAELPDRRCSVSEVVWGPWAATGRVEVVAEPTRFVDCGTPARYLAANLWRSGGASVLGPGAVVEGAVERCVLWPGAAVARGERLRDAIRTTGGLTVLVRRPVEL